MLSLVAGWIIKRWILRPEKPPERLDRFRATLLGRPGLLVCFVWSFAEAIFFFVVADVFISFVTLLSIQRGFSQIRAAVLGAALGGLVLYGFAQGFPQQAHALLTHVPWVRRGMIEDARRDLLEKGAWGVSRGPLKALPNKVYAVLAPERLSGPAYLVATVRARLLRFLTIWILFVIVRRLLRRWIDAYPRTSLAMLAVLWVVFYFTAVRAAVNAFGP